MRPLAEYVLVDQERARVETFYRQTDGVWAIGPTFTQLDQAAALRSLSIELPLSEIYAGIQFPPLSAPATTVATDPPQNEPAR